MVEPLQPSEKYPTHLVRLVSMLLEMFGKVEPPQTHVQYLLTPSSLCTEVVQEGFCGGSIWLNHSNLV